MSLWSTKETATVSFKDIRYVGLTMILIIPCIDSSLVTVDYPTMLLTFSECTKSADHVALLYITTEMHAWLSSMHAVFTLYSVHGIAKYVMNEYKNNTWWDPANLVRVLSLWHSDNSNYELNNYYDNHSCDKLSFMPLSQSKFHIKGIVPCSNG